MTAAACIIPLENSREPFWEQSARMYLESMIAYVLECLPDDEHNLNSVARLFSEMNSPCFNQLFNELSQQEPDSFAVARYNLTRLSP